MAATTMARREGRDGQGAQDGRRVNEADPRVKRTRKLLAQALVELLAEKNFGALSVQDIAERATLNRATFYAHFDDKYALFEHVVREWFRAELAERVPRPEDFRADDLPVLARAVLEFLGKIRDHCRPANRRDEPPIEAKVQDEVERFVLAWLRRAAPAESRARVPAEVAAAVVSWAVFGAGVRWSRGAGAKCDSPGHLTARGSARPPADETARQVAALLLGGLGPVVGGGGGVAP